MSYKLKEGVENFEVVNGAFAGRKFKKGFFYAKIPPEEAHKFEEVVEETESPKTKSATKNRAPETSAAGREEVAS